MNENKISSPFILKGYRMKASESFWFIFAIVSAMLFFKTFFMFGFHFFFFFLLVSLVSALLPSLALSAVFFFLDKKMPVKNVMLDGEQKQLRFGDERVCYGDIKKVLARDFGRFIFCPE